MPDALVTDTPPSANPIMKNISALMDMIQSLQGEVDKLTKEVNKLVQQATTSFSQSNDTTKLSSAGDKSNYENDQNEGGAGNEIAIIDSFAHAQDPNQRGSFTSDDIRLTSTPEPMPVRLQKSCVVQSCPSRSNSHPRSSSAQTVSACTKSQKELVNRRLNHMWNKQGGTKGTCLSTWDLGCNSQDNIR